MVQNAPKISPGDELYGRFVTVFFFSAIFLGQIEHHQNPGFSGSGQAGKPFKDVDGEAPRLFEGPPGRPGHPRPQKSRILPL